MEKTDIFALVNELQEEIEMSPTKGFNKNKSIDYKIVMEIIDDIKKALHDELDFSRRIMKEKDDILSEAEARANDIITSAKSRADQMIQQEAVSKAAYKMIEEVRRQFKADKGILEGTSKPDYKSCVSISTTAALHEMMLPGIMAVVVPVIVGVILGVEALGGLLSGALVTGVLMAIFMSNAGGAWDNAKKYIETGHHGGKGSEAHKAAVVGDTVGDPFKDTSGPAINILIKLMTIVSLVFAPLFLSIGGLL